MTIKTIKKIGGNPLRINVAAIKWTKGLCTKRLTKKKEENDYY